MLSLIITALFVNVHALVEKIMFPEKTVQAISGYLNRFATLRDVLPRHGAVGYIDGLADDELSTPREKYSLDKELPTTRTYLAQYALSPDKELPMTRVYLAQYALSPVILVRSLDYQFVVGNFIAPPADLEMYRKMGLVPFKDFGNGIIMFKRELR